MMKQMTMEYMKATARLQNMKLPTAQDAAKAKGNSDKTEYATLENRGNRVSKDKLSELTKLQVLTTPLASHRNNQK